MKQKILHSTLALLVLALLLTAPRAQQPATTSDDRVALYQALLDLQNPWTVMCVAAHPDDEDGTSLIVMRRKYGAHTVSLFSTFGEGGQNAIGPELYEEMGAIRARETMAASEIQGSEPYFLGLKDFGFSKSADEALRFWGPDEALRRMVMQIRKLRPDVIITNHDTGGGHGHHQVTGRAVVEAFDAAADPKRFPEQLKDGVTIWQVQRLFVRSRGAAADASIVTIDPNERDPARGTVYAEEALRALQQHATQGPWPKSFAERVRNSPDGKLPLIRYRLAREAKAAPALPSASLNFLDGLRLREVTAELIEVPKIDGRPLQDFSDSPQRVLEQLVKGLRGGLYGFSDDKTDEYRLLSMRDKLMRAMSLAASVNLQMTPSTRVGIPGLDFDVEIKIKNRGPQKVQVSGCGTNLGPKGGYLDRVELSAGSELSRTIKVAVPKTAGINVPLSSHLYESSAQGQELSTRCVINLPHLYFDLTSSMLIDIAPAVEIAKINPSPVVIRPDEVGVSSAGADVFPAKLPELRIELISYLDKRFNGEVLIAQNGQSAQTTRKIELLPRQITTLALPMPSPPKTAAAHTRSAAAESLSVTVKANSGSTITTRDVPIVRANARVARNLRVGYVRGFDFSLPQALNALGVESKELSVDHVRTADLSKFTSVIVDNRVYESQPELIAVNQKLLDYANSGGNLIVFYHKSDEWNPSEQKERPQLAPYKLILGGQRITDENAPITFLEADHPLLNVPNKLNQDDFKDWIQERGLYYPRDWDPQFHALLQSNDPGEAPLKGGLLVADYGKGHYIYTSMVWYRQLRAGVPGAYRMLANMISYGK